MRSTVHVHRQCSYLPSSVGVTTSRSMGAKKDIRALIFRFFLLAVYCLLGAGIFYAIEHNDNYEKEVTRKNRLLNETKRDIMQRFGINGTEFDSLVMKVIDARSYTPLEWTFSRGIDLCWQTITTVGYGNKTPTTLAGQLFLIPFTIFGIPLTVIMLNTIGQNICHFVGFIINTIENRLFGKKLKVPCKVKLLCSVSFLAISLLVIMAGISMKAEGWSFGLGLYVWFVTFTTVGFGDFIPGSGTDTEGGAIAIVYRLIFVMIGLSLISTIFNAMTDCIEEKRKKAESKSWISFLVSSFSSKKTTITTDNGTEMSPTVNNPTF